MAITTPSGLPANYSDPSVTQYGLISQLNIINVHAYNKFHETFGYAPYARLAQMSGAFEESDNEEFKWYQSHGRILGLVTAATTVSGAAGASITVTAGTGSYSFSGTKSLPTLGMVFRNSRTGVDSQVSAVPNKTTPNAHTFVLTPVISTENASVVAGDELLERGFIYVGEESDKKQTIIRNIDKYNNYCTVIRQDTTITDKAGAEKIEFQINGNYSFTYKQLRDDNLALMQQEDLLIMEGTQTNNLPYVEKGTNGVIKQVQANGINGTYNAWGVSTTFAQIERALNSVGASTEYDVLSDSASFIEMQNSIFTEINNGAIVYAANAGQRGGIDLERDFKSLRIYNRKYNFTNYGLFDEDRMYGASGTGARNRFSLFIPQGRESIQTSYDGPTVSVPKFTVMYQRPFGMGNRWHTKENGLFGEGNGGGTVANKTITTIGYRGVRVIGAQQYMIMKGN